MIHRNKILWIFWFSALLTRAVKGFATTTKKSSTRRFAATIEQAETIDDAYKPYQGEQPKEALSEIFVPQVFGHTFNGEDLDDERLWVPQTDTVSFRPLCFCVSGGYYVNLLRVKGAGLLSRHRHPGPVHGHVLKGKWSYLEHDWTAQEGSYVFEPPGEIHTLVVPEGVDEMVWMETYTIVIELCCNTANLVCSQFVFARLMFLSDCLVLCFVPTHQITI